MPTNHAMAFLNFPGFSPTPLLTLAWAQSFSRVTNKPREGGKSQHTKRHWRTNFGTPKHKHTYTQRQTDRWEFGGPAATSSFYALAVAKRPFLFVFIIRANIRLPYFGAGVSCVCDWLFTFGFWGRKWWWRWFGFCHFFRLLSVSLWIKTCDNIGSRSDNISRSGPEWCRELETREH